MMTEYYVVPTGFLGLGKPRVFLKDEVEVLEKEVAGSCGNPMTSFLTKSGEILKGYDGNDIVNSSVGG